MQPVIFRPAALARLSSPDKLDEAVRITGSRAWLDMGFAGLMLLAALVWSVLGTIESSVSGAGMIVRETGLSEVAAAEGGEIQGILVRAGDRVQAGDVIATLKVPSGGNRPLVAGASGQIVEVLSTPGAVLLPGAAIATIEPSDGELEAVVLVPAAQGKTIEPGMSVQIATSAAKKEEFGLMRGEVKSVSSFPASQRAIAARLGNEQLVRQLIGESPSVEVHVRLLHDASSPSGFAWTSRSGPPFAISSGTLVSADLVVSQRRPISLVLPLVR